MKRFKITFLALFSFITFPQAVIAGTAYVPGFTHHSNGTWCLTITNISNIYVDVTVKAYKSDGSIYSGPSVTNTVPSQFNTPFTLAPNHTTLLCARNEPGTSGQGFAVINGAPTDENLTGNSFLIAHGYYHPSSSATYSRNFPINSGMPF